jgi:hypothetical protein
MTSEEDVCLCGEMEMEDVVTCKLPHSILVVRMTFHKTYFSYERTLLLRDDGKTKK